MKEPCSAIPIDEIVSLSWYESSWKGVTKSAGGKKANRDGKYRRKLVFLSSNSVSPIQDSFLLQSDTYLWMTMIKKDTNACRPSYDYGTDESGCIPHPTINRLLCAAIGHRWP